MPLPSPENPPSPTDYRTIITRGCKSNDIPSVARGLQIAANDGKKDTRLLSSALVDAVIAGHTEVARYLLEQENAPIKNLSPFWVSEHPSPKLFQLLVDHGFDINKPAVAFGPSRGVYLLHRVCQNEEMVRWCLDHGARLDNMFVEPYTSPPLLQTVASLGTVPIFALLLEKGAKLEGRILHVAAGNVGSPPEADPERLRTRMAMVRYLVDDVGLDVNALDSEESMGNFWGTPICYAARSPFDCVEVVDFLLERGADPYIKERMDGRYNAFSYAKEANNSAITRVLTEWKLKHKEIES